MIALIITNIILVVVIGIVGVVLLAEAIKDSRPIVIKEAKALREYYEGKLEELQKKTAEAEKNCTEYKGLYEKELQKCRNIDNIRNENAELKNRVERLANELNSCDDRINDMALENARLKEQIKALEKPASKKPAKKGKNDYEEAI